MSASTPARATRSPKLSVSDLPMGAGYGRIPSADEVHPRNWFVSPPIIGAAGVQSTAHGLGRTPSLFLVVPTAMGPIPAAGSAITAQVATNTDVGVIATVTMTYKIFAI